MVADGGAVGVVGGGEDRGARFDKAMKKSLTTYGAGAAVKETREASGAAHLESNLQEVRVNDLAGSASTACVYDLHNREVGAFGWINGLMACRVEVGEHVGQAELESVIVRGRDGVAVL